MASNLPIQTIFLDKFVEFNKDRYKDDAEMLALFDGLTLADITISDITADGTNPELQSATVTSVSRNFKGVEQKWLPANINTPFAFVVVNKGAPLTSEAELADQTTPGAYVYLVGEGEEAVQRVGLVLASTTTTETQAADALALFKANFEYVLDDADVDTATAKVLKVTTNPFTRGELVYEIGKAPIIEIPETDYGRLEFKEITQPEPEPQP